MKKQNLSKGKKLETITDFAKIYTTLSVDQKSEVLKNIDTRLKTKTNPDGSAMTDGQFLSLTGLQAWCMVNILVGEELCPHTSVLTYIKNR